MKHVKTFYALAMTVTLLLLGAIFSYAADTEVWDISRDGESSVSATLNKNAHGEGRHELLISGNGEMKSFSSSDVPPWQDFMDSIISVVVDVGVESISANSFNECYNLESLTVKSLHITIPVTADIIPYTAVIRAHLASSAAEYAEMVGYEFEHICDFEGSYCSVCEYECISHTGGEATCTSGKLCDVCRAEYTEPRYHEKRFVPNKSADCYNDGMSEHYKCDLCSTFFDTDGNVISEDELIISASHIFGELVSARAPTCVSQGNRAYYHCSVCNKNFDESREPLNEIYIPATGIHSGGIATCTTLAICDWCNNAYGETAPYNHSFASSYTYSSSKHWHACICGEKSGTEEHSYTEKITKPATETEEGTKELSCVCGYVVEENIPMLEGAPSPKPTPDSSLPKQKSISAWIWIPISLSALIVLGLAFVLIRHKNKKRKD